MPTATLPTADDLTLYRLSTDDPATTQALYGADDVLVLGRDTAEEVAEDLIWRPDVLTVTTLPLAWGSLAELDALAECEGNGADLGGALLPLAADAGLVWIADAAEMLDALRAEGLGA
jgi:hypothetical protein